MDYMLKGYEDLELSTQSIIREALKRRIEVEILDPRTNIINLRKGEKSEYIQQATRTSADSYISSLLMANKSVTKKILHDSGIRVPQGKEFTDLKEGLSHYHRVKGSVVVKPNETNFGTAVSILKSNFTHDEYEQALSLAFDHGKVVLVEEYLSGTEYRFLIIGDEVRAVLQRVPANIQGDGTSTISQLVKEKNKDPLRGKGYKRPLEMLELGDVELDYLKDQGLKPSSVPKESETVFLRKNSNISTGGDSIDLTDHIHPSYKKIALKAVKVLGARISGVDMIVKNLHEPLNTENYGIIELNFNPAIHIHNYPFKGKNRKAEEAILDLIGF